MEVSWLVLRAATYVYSRHIEVRIIFEKQHNKCTLWNLFFNLWMSEYVSAKFKTQCETFFRKLFIIHFHLIFIIKS